MSHPINALPPPERLRALDTLCDAFEESWKNGQRPVIEELLGKVAEDVRPVLLAELIRIELEWRCRLGEEPSEEEYRMRFLSCGDLVADWLAEARRSAKELSALSSCETTSSCTPNPAGDANMPDAQAKDSARVPERRRQA